MTSPPLRGADATRARLVAAAQKAFSERGFERTTVREIAEAAGVNPALINRYFGGKEQLFAEAVSIDLRLPDLSAVARDGLGRALVAHFFQRWEEDLLQVLIRTAATHEAAAARMREILADQVEVMVREVAGPDRARDRASLIATQVLGVAYFHHVLGLGPDDLRPVTARVMLGETIQRYLTAALPED